jgi:NADPH:quinone reductase-like Zn-dependent oxidoreductase
MIALITDRPMLATMSAVVFHRFGGPEVLDVEKVPRPEPGPGEVLLAVESVGVGRLLDITTRAGRHPYATVSFPHILGADHAGSVVAVGPEVGDVPVGQRVAVFPGCACGTCAHCADGHDEACTGLRVIGVDRPGAYAQYAVVPVSALFPVPDDVTVDDAAALVLTGSVAWNQLDAAGLEPGERVLVQAASSALGSTTAALARHLGAEVIVTSRDPQKRRRLTELGFDAVLDSAADDLTDQIHDRTGGAGVDVAVDNVGSPSTWAATMGSLAPRGRVVCSGAFAAGGAVPVDLNVLYSRNLRLIGVRTGNRRSTREAWGELANGFRPVVDRVFPLEQAGDAHSYMESGGGVGRVLLRPPAG